MAKKASAKKTVAIITHDAAKRKNIPTAEYQSVVKQEQLRPVPVKYPQQCRPRSATGLARQG